jgi:hypothetical protein
MEALAEILAIEDEGGGAEVGVHVVAEIDLEDVEVLVVKVVGALAVPSAVHGLGVIDVGDGLEIDFREVDVALAAVVVDLHEGDEAETRKLEREGKVEHFLYFVRRVDIAADQVAAGIDLLQINILEEEGVSRDADSVDLGEFGQVVVME